MATAGAITMNGLSDQSQLVVVAGIVFVAIGYLVVRAKRALLAREDKGGCGSCGVAHQRLTVKRLVTLEGLPARGTPAVDDRDATRTDTQ